MIKKVIAYMPCNLCYWLGCAFSYGPYFLYSTFMIWSLKLNDWGGLNLWTENKAND